ncbi:phage holin family protein [Pseudomonadota bacterium]
MAQKIIIGVILNSIALYIVTWLLPDIIYTGGLRFYILGGAIIGLVNTFVKPIMTLLSLPLVIATVGLFIFVVNAITFALAMWLVNVIDISGVSVTIDEPINYVLASLVFTFVNWILHIIINNKKK